MPRTSKPTTKTPKPRQGKLAWTAAEFSPTRHWWWYGGWIFFGLWLSILLITLGQWYTLAALVVGITAIVVTSSRPPISKFYELRKGDIIVDGHPYPMATFRYFCIDEQVLPSDDSVAAEVVLVPRRVLALPVVAPLTGDAQRDEELIAAIAAHVELRTDPSNGIWLRITKWTHL